MVAVLVLGLLYGTDFCAGLSLRGAFGMRMWGGCWFIDFLARRSCVDSSFAAFTAVKFCGLACLMLCVDVCFGF